VNDKYWSKHTGTAMQKIDLDDFVLVKQQNKFYPYSVAKAKIPGLSEKVLKNQVETGFSDTSLIPNASHTVCIVGYDANGFLIKNSWGEDWGDKGYGWISFDYHRLLAIEALLIISGTVDGDPSKEPLSVIPGDIWLKSCPLFMKANAAEGTPDQTLMGFSITYHGAGMIPRFEKIEYKIYDDYAKLIETNTVTIKKTDQEKYDGHEEFVLEKSNTDPGKKFTVAVTFTPVLQRPFTNTYELVEKVTKEYRPRK
jgi:hypothetical protein